MNKHTSELEILEVSGFVIYKGQKTIDSLEVQVDHQNNRFSPKTIVLVGNFNHPKLGIIILIVLDFQGIVQNSDPSSKGSKAYSTEPRIHRNKILQVLSFKKNIQGKTIHPWN